MKGDYDAAVRIQLYILPLYLLAIASCGKKSAMDDPMPLHDSREGKTVLGPIADFDRRHVSGAFEIIETATSSGKKRVRPGRCLKKMVKGSGSALPSVHTVFSVTLQSCTSSIA